MILRVRRLLGVHGPSIGPPLPPAVSLRRRRAGWLSKRDCITASNASLSTPLPAPCRWGATKFSGGSLPGSSA